jgi:transcriptional regulator with XRE-family HTH domain
MDPAVLSKVERADRLPTVVQTSRLAEYFGIPEEDLQARRMATEFVRRYGTHTAASQALDMIQELLANGGCFPGQGHGGGR